MKDLKYRKHVFFDWDDTLWDFQFNSEKVLKELFHEHGLQEKLKADVNNFTQEYKRVNLKLWTLYGQGKIDKMYLREQRFKETFQLFNYSHAKLETELTLQYLARAPKGSQLKKGCLEILNYLKRHYTLHIITNGFSEIQGVKIDNSGIRYYFNTILVGEEYTLSKPDERIFRLAEKLSGAKTSECIMVGDHLENDIKGALNAGWEAIHLDNEQSSEHSGLRINELSELKNWF